MSDLISRQSAIYELLMERPDEVRFCFPCREVLNIIKNLPSAQPEWIPVSEKLPEDDELMFVTYIDPREIDPVVWIGWHEMENVWYIDGEAHCTENGNRVIAWMPLPEPYKEDKDE